VRSKDWKISKKFLKTLVESNKTQAELVSKAMRIPDENVASEKAHQLVLESDLRSPAGSGGMASALTKAFCPDFGK